MARPCAPSLRDASSPWKILRQFRAAWQAFRSADHNVYGEAAWFSRDFIVSMRRDGDLELIAIRGDERMVLLRPRAHLDFGLDMSRRAGRPDPHAPPHFAACARKLKH
jgi:hypothetical protein